MINPEYLKMLLQRQLMTLRKLQLNARLTGLEREEVIERCLEISTALSLPTFNPEAKAEGREQ